MSHFLNIVLKNINLTKRPKLNLQKITLRVGILRRQLRRLVFIIILIRLHKLKKMDSLRKTYTLEIKLLKYLRLLLMNLKGRYDSHT